MHRCMLLVVALMPRVYGSSMIFHSPKFAAHTTPSWHPECAARTDILAAIVSAMDSRAETRAVDALHPLVESALGRVHTRDYLSSLAEPVGPKETRRLDEDTFASQASWNVSRLASSAWLRAVDAAGDQTKTAFGLSRPPGHHAGPASACGFCLVNHAAAAVAHALVTRARVALLDIDVHFGNGCASIFGTYPEIFEKDRVRFCWIHQDPAFPHSGGAGHERRFYDKDDGVLRFLPLPPGTRGSQWLSTLTEDALPFLRIDQLDPHLIIVSAGFDALASDKLAQFELLPADFRSAGRAIREHFPNVPVAAGLEGGYDTEALPEAIGAFLDGLDHEN